jgi:hypothetical protein
MDEGMEHDDKYRMVEDEFLSVAQKFTVHLHTAEYRRREKDVKSCRADAINSISRPVTVKMPDHTKRKIASVAQSKAQRGAIEDLAKKKSGKEDESDSDEGIQLPYIGTTLHGLMDSPRKKSKSLGQLNLPGGLTRAGAGYQKPTGQSGGDISRVTESPKSKVQNRLNEIINIKDDSMHSQDHATCYSVAWPC